MGWQARNALAGPLPVRFTPRLAAHHSGGRSNELAATPYRMLQGLRDLALIYVFPVSGNRASPTLFATHMLTERSMCFWQSRAIAGGAGCL